MLPVTFILSANIVKYIQQISIMILMHSADIGEPTNLSRIVEYNKQCTVQKLYICLPDTTDKS